MKTMLSLFVAALSVSLFIIKNVVLFRNMLVYIKEAVYYSAMEDDLILIGITSAQDHFKQRQSLRDTWLTMVSTKPRINYYFVIGKGICQIPPLDRESFSICEEKKYNLPDNVFEWSTVHNDFVEVPLYSGHGFQFTVNHEIIVHSLGIRRDVLVHTRTARVSLYDSFRQERLVSVTFTLDKDSKKDYIWKKVPSVLVPIGTEVEVRVDGAVDGAVDLSLHCKYRQTWSDGGGVIRFLNIVTPNSTVKFSKNSCSLSAFNFTIHELDKLKATIASKADRLTSWLNYTKHLQKELEQEVSMKKDLLLLDMMDVYRNLPLKILKFFQWAAEIKRFKYLLKTDDDTFINIKRVESELKQNTNIDWWSCFRKGWPVQRAGKWKETTFNETVYPTFPSGSGYVLSRNLVLSIHRNVQTDYQGEDVAIGIWLRDYKLKEHVGKECLWTCDEDCYENSCNIGQLSVEDMYITMKYFNFTDQRTIYCMNEIL